MKYIVATSDIPYFRWQMLVQINNFKKNEMLDDLIYVVNKDKRKSKFLGYIEKETGVKIFTYKDTRKSKKYSSSIRPHVIKKFLKENSEYENIFFYLDPDVLFTKKIEYPSSVTNTKTWVLSDTKSYIDSKYIKSKSTSLFKEMCSIVDINPTVVESNDVNAGGAQYIVKDTDYKFWDKVESDCEKLYNHMITTSSKYSPEKPIQSWTADMWSLLWNAWLHNKNTLIWKELNFSWATSKIDLYNKNNIYHNAGVFNEKNLFNKCNFINKHPFNEVFNNVSKEYCSYNYTQEILNTKKNYSDLIKKL